MGKRLERKEKPIILILIVLLLAPSTISIADGGGKTTANLCRNCHGENYGDYLTLSQLSIPSEVEEGEEFTVSVRVDISGNLDPSIQHYWYVDFDITLSSQEDLFSFSPATHSFNDYLPGDSVIVSWQLTADQGGGPDSLQAFAYSVAQHFGRSGTDQLSGNINVVEPNVAPQLSAPSCSPDEGGLNQLFNFQVTWTDLNNDLPFELSVIVDDNPFILTPVDSISEEPLSGMRYSSSSMILDQGYHTYFFQGSDGEDAIRLPLIDAVTNGSQGPLIGVFSGPFVGNSPIIHEENMVPLHGDNQTNFTYSILITPEDELTNTNITLWLDGIASDIVPTISEGGPGQKWFNFTTLLNSGVSHFHYFTATNSFGISRLPVGTSIFDGPIIIGDVLSKASINPPQGDERTPFTFTINYSNPIGIAPSKLSLIVDGVDVPMNVSSQNPDWNEEHMFSVQLDMEVGSHSYYFLAIEEERSHRIPDQGELNFIVNRFDSDPWLSNASIFIAGNLTFDDGDETNTDNIENVTRPLVIKGTDIEVRITFHDAEGDDAKPGSVMAWVDGLAYQMQGMDANNATIGQVWSLSIPQLEVGTDHFVWFTATSSNSGTTTEISVRHPIEIGYIFPLPDVRDANIPPIIQSPTNGEIMLFPLTGGVYDNYTFLIEIVDLDWDDTIGLTVWLELDGNIHLLQPVNGSDHRNGTLFGITLKLSEGEHTHRFGIQDAEDITVYPSDAFLNGPIVQSNLVPAGVASHIFVSWAWWLVLPNLLLIIGGIGWGVHTLIHARRAVNEKAIKQVLQTLTQLETETVSEIAEYENSFNNEPVCVPNMIDLGGMPQSEPVMEPHDTRSSDQSEYPDDWKEIDW